MRTEIRKRGKLFALLVDLSDAQDGTHPASEHSWPQQVLLMKRPKGYVVRKHTHKKIPRTSAQPMEALVVIKGEVQATIFDRKGAFIAKKNVASGQCLIILDGAHEVTFTKNTSAYEFKPGPYKKEEKRFL